MHRKQIIMIPIILIIITVYSKLDLTTVMTKTKQKGEWRMLGWGHKVHF